MIVIARKVKCQRCKEQFERFEGNYVQLSSGYAHKECEEKHQSIMKERGELIKYIEESYGLTRITPDLLAEIKRYKDKNNYRYAGMKMTLNYAFDVLKMIPDIKYRLGVIPKFYDKARVYYQTEKNAPKLTVLLDYIKKQLNIPRVTQKIEQQIQDFVDIHKMTYDDIKIVLEYGYENKNKSKDIRYGIGFVPYVYEEAMAHHSRKMKYITSDFQIETKVVKTSPRKYKPRLKEIDMEQFEEDDDE